MPVIGCRLYGADVFWIDEYWISQKKTRALGARVFLFVPYSVRAWGGGESSLHEL